jgi:sugar (pentulose or hexulose) kinase
MDEKHPLSLGIDTWGADYCLFSKGGNLIGNPYHYLDNRTADTLSKVNEVLSDHSISANLGAVHPQSTLCQLVAAAKQEPEMLLLAEKLLFMPDALAYMLTGEFRTEHTIASTSCLYDAINKCWRKEIITLLGLPIRLFGDFAQAGTKCGALHKSITDEFGGKGIDVITVAGHDTASAVSVIPTNEDFLFISCGTCSVTGVCTNAKANINPSDRIQYEVNASGKLRYVKNVMGLFFLQQCFLEWKKEDPSLNFSVLQKMAEIEKPFLSFLNFEAPELLSTGNMPKKISAFLLRTNQPQAQTPGDFVLTILQTLAMYYKQQLAIFENAFKKTFDKIYMIGGGIQNTLLCSFVANATKREVIALCPEAAVTGNCVTQLQALRELSGQSETIELISRSFPSKRYFPSDTELWDTAYENFLKIQQHGIQLFGKNTAVKIK